MSDLKRHPEESQLTAFVLDELDEARQRDIAAHLDECDTCRLEVEACRQASAALFQALQSEPVPALSDAQRQAIHQAAQPAPQRLVRVPEPATRGRRGIVPLLAATLACAALLVGVSVWNFERPDAHTAATFDAAEEQLLALNSNRDASGLVDELRFEELDRVSRMDSLAATAEGEEQLKKHLGELSGESAELQQIVDYDSEGPALGMTVREVRLQDGRPALTAEQLQGLATMTTRSAAPGNLGDVSDPSVDYLQRPFSSGSRTESATPAPTSGPEAKPVGTDAGSAHGSNRDAATNVLRSPVTEYRQPTVQYERKLGQQASEKGARGGEAAGRSDPVPGGGPQSGQGQPGEGDAGQGQPAPRSNPAARWGDYSKAKLAAKSDGAAPSNQGSQSFRFNQPATANAPQQTGDPFGAATVTNPAPPVSEPAAGGMVGRRNTEFFYEAYGASGAAAESGAMPQPSGERGEALQENLAGMPPPSGVEQKKVEGFIVDFVDPQPTGRNLDIPYRQGSFELGVPQFGTAAGHQFVPMFAVTDLQRRAEQPTDGSGLAAGATINIHGNGVPPVMSNSATSSDEMLLGARLRIEGEGRGLNEQEGLSQDAWGTVPLSWENGRWYAITRGGRKLAVDVPGTEAYAPIEENEFLSPADQPLSTFGLDVDTASYANVRRFLMEHRRFPPPDAVRIEEMVNYFTYSDAAPTGADPLAVHLESSACPWNTEHRLVRVGLKARQIDLAERPATTLVFLVDTSGSMRDDNKLPLVKNSLRILVDEMTENDRIAIVTYSSNAGLLLDSTSGEQKGEILAAIDGLQANGSTNGEAGLKLAYEIATRHFIRSGQNRVILCTDGDFNVGTSATDPLVKMITDKRDSGVFLSICGYGSGNIKDEKLERIADTGNGQYHYVDNLKEARKVFLDELTGTLYTVAKDVKLQVEFNPAHVASYRLLGYENRKLAAEDFNNDRVDSGDMGAGHSVTALYEVVPVGVEVAKPASATPGVDPLKYQGAGVRGQESDTTAEGRERSAESTDPLTATQRGAPLDAADAKPSTLNPQPSTSNEWLTVKLRYKQPDGETSVKREFPLVVEPGGNESPSTDLEWSAAVASFGMLLRSSSHAGQSSLEGVLELAQGAKDRDESGRRREFIDMVLQTRSLVRGLHGSPAPEPRELSSTDARKKATVAGKYEDLMDKFEARDDVDRYGEFHEYGWSEDKTHAGREGLPAGYWVYVYPDWYIWGETVSKRE